MAKKAILALLVIGLAACSQEPREPMTEGEVRSIVYQVVDEYQVPTPRITFDPDSIRFKDNSLAEAHCNVDTGECLLVFEPCALHNRNIEELAAHEAAHVVVAYKYRKFDHGKEWQRIMFEQGYSRANKSLHNSRC